MHAYGAAIDLNVKYADYWRWSKDLNAPTWKNRIPIEIVRTFESTASFGVAIGITLIQCISSTDRSCCRTSLCSVEKERRRSNKRPQQRPDDHVQKITCWHWQCGIAIGAPTLAQAQQLIGSYVALLKRGRSLQFERAAADVGSRHHQAGPRQFSSLRHQRSGGRGRRVLRGRRKPSSARANARTRARRSRRHRAHRQWNAADPRRDLSRRERPFIRVTLLR